MTIPTITLILILFANSIFSLSIGWFLRKKYCNNQISHHVCPFNDACTKYDPTYTKEAAKRVATLLINNMEEETKYKKALRQFIQSQP